MRTSSPDRVLIFRPPGEVVVEMRQLDDSRPYLFVRSPEELEDLVDLVDFRVSWKDGATCDHLGKNAAHTPHVQRGRVHFAPQENLGGPVPEGHDLVGVDRKRDTEAAGETEIRELEIALLVDQNVLWLEVSMHEAIYVTGKDGMQELLHEGFDESWVVIFFSILGGGDERREVWVRGIVHKQ